VAGSVETPELLDVEMDHLARPRTLVAPRRFERSELRHRRPRQPSGHRGTGHAQLARNLSPGQAQAAPQMQGQRDQAIRQPRRHADGRACAIGERRLPVRAEPCQPLADAAGRHAEGCSDFGGLLSGGDAEDDLLSTVKDKADTMMRVVHPAHHRPEFGNCSLTPFRVNNLPRVHS
jgi:hypothetical protein